MKYVKQSNYAKAIIANQAAAPKEIRVCPRCGKNVICAPGKPLPDHFTPSFKPCGGD